MNDLSTIERFTAIRGQLRCLSSIYRNRKKGTDFIFRAFVFKSAKVCYYEYWKSDLSLTNFDLVFRKLFQFPLVFPLLQSEGACILQQLLQIF